MDSAEQDTTSLKARKEAFVTGHDGSTAWEVLWVCSSVIWGCWLYSEFAIILSGKKDDEISSKKLQLILLEATLVWLPMVLTQSEYLYPYGSLFMVGQAILAGILSHQRRSRENDSSTDSETNTSTVEVESTMTTTNTRLDYLTLYRSTIYFLTFVAILAVDFPLFPRRFCKTETEGYGLMDVGAASFVISGGIVCGKAYTKKNNKNDSTTSRRKNWSLIRPLVKAAPLIIIGIIRCVTNKGLEYQEHVTEYGVHWNFFFTLGVLAVVPTIRRELLLQQQQQQQNDLLIKAMRYLLVWSPLLCLLLYQYELWEWGNPDSNGLQAFILSAPRSPAMDGSGVSTTWMRFFFANREGILGCIGYCFLHAAGEWIGATFVFGDNNKNNLGTVTLSAWIALGLTTNRVLGLTVSRRETNLPFCLWSLAHNLTILWGFQLLCRRRNTTLLPPGFASVNRHGMVSFLVANLLTGAVNLLIPTIDTGDGIATVILIVYLLVVGSAALLLDGIASYRRKGDGTVMKKSDTDNKTKKTN